MNTKNKYIPGIYNYCDYWCARCAFTKRCRNFITDRELEIEMAGADATRAEPDDATNADFWSHIANKARVASIFGKADEWHDGDFNEDDFEIDPAWQDREDAILKLLSLLDRMQRGVHAALPGAKAFFRPGFDGEPPEDD